MLIPCVDCGNKVSDQARACPKCGCPVRIRLADDTISKSAPPPSYPVVPEEATRQGVPEEKQDPAFPWQILTPDHGRCDVPSDNELMQLAHTLDPASTVVDARGVHHARLGNLDAYVRARVQQSLTPPGPPPGLGGCLTFLVIGLMVLGPLLAVGRTIVEFDNLRRANPAGMAQHVMQLWVYWYWILVIAFCIYSIVIGNLLRTSRRRSVVSTAITFLWLNGPGFIFSIWVMSAAVLGGTAANQIVSDPGFIGSSILHLTIVPLVWTIFLVISQRVQELYIEP